MSVVFKEKIYIEDLYENNIEYHKKNNIKLYCKNNYYIIMLDKQCLYYGFNCIDAVQLYNRS